MEKAKEAKERERETERIKEEGRKLREEKEREMRQREEEEEKASASREEDVPQLGVYLYCKLSQVAIEPLFPGNLDTTVKLKYSLSSHPDLTTPSSVSSLLSQFGPVDTASIVLSFKAPKKAPHKPPKHGIALVPFTQIGAAFAAVCASNRKDCGLEDVDVTWAVGTEPEIIGWLRRKGKLNTSGQKESQPVDSKPTEPESGLVDGTAMSSTFTTATGSAPTPFSSFPDNFVSSRSYDDCRCILTF